MTADRLAALEAEVERLREFREGCVCDRLVEDIREHLPSYVHDDGSGVELNELETIEQAGCEILTLQKRDERKTREEAELKSKLLAAERERDEARAGAWEQGAKINGWVVGGFAENAAALRAENARLSALLTDIRDNPLVRGALPSLRLDIDAAFAPDDAEKTCACGGDPDGVIRYDAQWRREMATGWVPHRYCPACRPDKAPTPPQEQPATAGEAEESLPSDASAPAADSSACSIATQVYRDAQSGMALRFEALPNGDSRVIVFAPTMPIAEGHHEITFDENGQWKASGTYFEHTPKPNLIRGPVGAPSPACGTCGGEGMLDGEGERLPTNDSRGNALPLMSCPDCSETGGAG